MLKLWLETFSDEYLPNEVLYGAATRYYEIFNYLENKLSVDF